jgi:hypothetical protein
MHAARKPLAPYGAVEGALARGLLHRVPLPQARNLASPIHVR